MRHVPGVALAAGCVILGSCGRSPAPATPSAPVNAAPSPARESQAADSIHFGQRTIPARTPGAMRVATYNLLNLFDDIDDPALSGDEEDIDDAKPASERQAVAAAIRRLDADVLALQEIESEAALTEFRDIHLAGMGYDYLVSVDTGDPRGIECAVLSRYPLTGVEHWAGLELGGTHPELWGNNPNDWAGEAITFKRSPLKVVVEVPGMSDGEGGGHESYTLALVVLHNKSGGPGGYWREAESRKVVEIVGAMQRENPDANIMVLGDLNATSEDQSVLMLLGAGLVEILPDDGSRGNELISHESGRRIDHILVGQAMLPEIVGNSAFIMGTPSREPGADWRTTPAPAGLASDHFPVAVELWIGDQ